MKSDRYNSFSMPGFIRPVLITAGFACSLLFSQAFADNGAGSVSFVVGEAYIADSDGDFRRVEVGDQIGEGVRIKTLSGGHVHMRFADGGLVSVRPNSNFAIEYYQYDQAAPDESVIRFNLKSGVARSISGKGAKAARDKFRMNTPIAAIGVRGTDFVVSAQAAGVKALVNEGAIVLAPFSEGCVVDAVGPCEVNGVELSELSDQLLELTANAVQPRLVPRNARVNDEFRSEQFDLKRQNGSEQADTGPDNEATVDSDVQEGVDGDLHVSRFGANDEEGALRDQVDELTTKDQVDTYKDIKVNYVPDTPVAAETLNQRQLVWGRWGNDIKATDRLVGDWQSISEGRHITVGNQELALYRTGTIYNGLASNLGKVDFNLVDAQAVLVTPLQSSQMEVNGGSLSIDFDADTYTTQLDLYHFKTSDVTFSSSGDINHKGYFITRDGNSFLSGATSLDGSEASYLFNQKLESGVIQGITYWNKQ